MEMEYWRKEETNQVYGFDVSEPSQVEAMNNLLATGTWTNITGNWPPPPAPPTAEQNKQLAMSLLQQTDWVVLADVDDPNIIPHLLNKSEFISYRADLRKIAVNPTAGDLQWPTKPVEQWSE